MIVVGVLFGAVRASPLNVSPLMIATEIGLSVPGSVTPGPVARGRRFGVDGSPTGKHDSCLMFMLLNSSRGSTWVSHSLRRLRTSATWTVPSVPTP